MFAWYLQRLTLFAFTAHAVLGCCWHHGHPIGSQCCLVEELTKQDSALETVAGSSVSSQCACHCSAKAPPAPPTVNSSSQVQSQLASYDAPWDGSHPCQEARCRFVSTKLLLLERADKIASGEWLDTATSLTAESTQLRAAGCRLQPVLYRQLATAGAQCAILQSWQI